MSEAVPPNRERGDFIGDDLSGVHTCHAECPCRESGPDPVAVPEKVEAVARAIADEGFNHGQWLGTNNWEGLGPNYRALYMAQARAALAAFRATEDGS